MHIEKSKKQTHFKTEQNIDDSSCTTMIFVQSDALKYDNVPPILIIHTADSF